MKRRTASFTGMRPIFTGSPSIVMGGFNLDVANQKFDIGDVIPAGTLAIKDEVTRLVQVIKTAKVVEIDGENDKIVYLHVDEFFKPIFAVGDAVLKTGTAATAMSSVPVITAIDKKYGIYKITLSKSIDGLAAGDVLEEVVADDSDKSKSRGYANSVTIRDEEVDEFETGIDVTADTMQYALYENRVPPIPASQKDATGDYLSVNPHVKLTKSH